MHSFYTTIDLEYRGFVQLRVPLEDKRSIVRRVAAAIRTIAAFSAWYAVAWKLLRASVTIAQMSSAIVTGILIYSRFVADARWPNALVALAALLGSIALLTLAVSKLPRRWPRNAIVLLVAGAACLSLTEFAAMANDGGIGVAAGLAAAVCGSTFCAIMLLAILAVQTIVQVTTWRKISRFPEEEIIQSVAFLLTALDAAGDGWRLPEERARIAVTLEWIARRFEADLTRRYLATGSNINPVISAAAAEIGAAFRARKIALVFPATRTLESLREFLWHALRCASANNWDALERCAPLPPAPRRGRLRDAAGSIAGIGLPLVVGIAILFIPDLPTDYVPLRNNASFTLSSWSLLSILAVLNPRQFEPQLSAAKTLGDLLKKGAG